MTTQCCKSESRTEADSLRVALEAAPVGIGGSPAGAGAPERILIVPWGEVESEAGSFLFDDAAADETLAAFSSHGTDLPIDYEHQTLGGSYSSPTGQAPAAGWITELVKVAPESAGRDNLPTEPGLWGRVTWTGEGSEMLVNREYRYLSPVALVRRSDRRLIGLHSVALTNKPAIVGMRPIVNGGRGARDAVTSTGDCGASSHWAALRISLSLDESADEALVLRTAVGRIRTMEAAEKQRRAETRVAAVMSVGKLTAAQRDWALGLALRDPAEFDRWAADAPCVVTLGRVGEPPRCHTSVTQPAHRAVESAAREEWRANRVFLEKLCGEEAYVQSAVRGLN